MASGEHRIENDDAECPQNREDAQEQPEGRGDDPYMPRQFGGADQSPDGVVDRVQPERSENNKVREENATNSTNEMIP